MKSHLPGSKNFLGLCLLLWLAILLPVQSQATPGSQAHNLFVANLGNGNGQGSITEIMTNGTAYPFATNLDDPYGLVFDRQGDLFVADYAEDTIYEFTNGYRFGQTPVIFANHLNSPVGLAIDAAGNLYEADDGSGAIYEFTNGYQLGQTPVTFANNLNSPISLTGLAFDPAGNLYAGDDGSGTILEFTNGYQLGQTPVTFADNLFAPTGLAFDRAGNLFVTDGDGSIEEFATNGTRSTFTASLDYPIGVALDVFGNVYAADFSSGAVYAFATNGTQRTFASGLNPTFLAFDPLTVTATTLAAQASPNPSVFGESVTFTATVTQVALGIGTPTGTVNFFDGATLLGSSGLTNGQATATVSSLAVGAHNIQMIYSGDVNFLASTNSTTLTVNPADTTTALSSAPNPTVYGQVTTLTASVAVAAPGAGTPSGTVNFFDGATLLGSSVMNSNVATLNVSSLLAGSHNLTATYAGNSSFNGSTSAMAPQVVNPANTTTAGQASPNPTVFGQSATFTATISAVAPGAGTPTGTVTFFDGATSLGSGAVNEGVATFTTSGLSVGIHTIQMSYSGDANFAASTNTVSQTVNAASTTTSLNSVPNPTVYGQAATLTATVAVLEPGAGIPAGTVTFFDGAVSLGTSSLNSGSATLTVSNLIAGSHSLTVAYAGNGTFNGSTSAPVTQVVNQAGTSTRAQVLQGSTVYGQPANIMVMVSATLPGAGTPTGTVTLSEGTTNLDSTTLTNGQTLVSVSTLSVGVHNLVLTYSGDANFLTSSKATNQIVHAASTTTALTSTPNPTVYGQATTLTATISVVAPGAGTPTGIVTFFEGTTNLGSGTLNNSNATLTVASLLAGSHNLTAVYAGDGSFNGSTSSISTQTVNPASTTTAAQSSPNPTVVGQNATFTATISAVAPGAGTPTGTVTFLDGTTNLGSSSLNNGVATWTTANLAVGTHTIQMIYSGDANFVASSNTATQIVNPANTTTALITSPNPTVYGQAISLTATVSVTAPGAGTPTGTVTFFNGTSNLGNIAVTNGIATLSVSSLVAGSHSLTAVYSRVVSFNGSISPAVTNVVNQATVNVRGLLSPGLSVYGQPVTITSFITAVAPGAGTPTGTVTLFDGTNTVGSTALTNGQTALTVSSFSVGTHNLLLDYSGDANFLTGSFTTNQLVVAANTTTVLASAPNPTVYGQAATLTATISVTAPGAGTPTGTVTFLDGATTLGSSSLNNGTATLSTSNLVAGNHSLTAVYAGDGSFNGSTSATTTQVVNQASTSTAAQATPNPTVFGQNTTFTATLSAVTPGAGIPTGTVTFVDGTNTLGSSALNNGVATWTTSSLSVGTHDIQMNYSGDANFVASTSTLDQDVTTAGSTTTALITPNPTVFGQPAAFTVNVSATAPGAGTPTGTVTFFYNDTNNIGTNVLVNGLTSITNATLPVGTNLITVVYSGDSDFNGGTISTNLVVNQAATTNVVVSDINPSVPGLAVTYTATVAAVAPGAGVPTGTVTFYCNGTNSFGTNSLVNGTTSVTNASLPVGTNLVTAVYSGDTNFTASTTPAWSQTVISLTDTQALTTGTVVNSGKLFLQSGLMQQLITITNLTSGTYTAVRVTLHLTQSGISVYDATGTNASGDAYLQYNYPVPPHGTVTFAVEYYVANRTTIPNPVITVTLTPAQAPTPVPNGAPQAVVQTVPLAAENAFLVGFETQLNASYYVLYSSDLVNWTVVLPAVKGTGSEVQWLDLGPPLTQSAPGAQPQRFYRVIKAQ